MGGIMTRRTGADTAGNRRRHVAKSLSAATAVLGVATVGAWGTGHGDLHTQGAQRVNYAASAPLVTTPSSPGVERAAAAGQKVTIANFAFSPSSLTVKRGTTVTWTNTDSAPHTVTGGPLSSPTLGQGARYSYTFKTTGTFSYICAIHPFMHGSVTVK